MPTDPRRLGKVIAGAGFAADVAVLSFNVDNGATADATYQLGALPRCRIRKAWYVQESAATAATSFFATLQNATGPVDVTGDLDIDALGAATAGAFVMSTVAGARDFAEGDILQIVFDETGGTVTAPDLVGVVVEIQLLD